MFDLTPSERRGALMLLVLCALGTAWDLLAPAGPAPPVPPEPAPAAAAGAPPPAAGAAPVDLNAADPVALDRLPGIGPVLARRIVEHRERSGPFRTVDELGAVPGIGPRLLERLRPLVRAGRSPGRAVQDATPRSP